MSKKIVVFGEILLRYSAPDREMLLQTPRINVWVGGAEANVATALARLGHDVDIVSAVPSNALGDAAVRELRGHCVSTTNVIRSPGRMGIYYVATGAGRRATEVTYDRAGSSFANAGRHSWNWKAILENASHFHLSGITPALGPNSVGHAFRAVEAAVEAGVTVSFDGNFRASLWALWDGKPAETLRRIIERVDILFGNQRDISLVLGSDFGSTPGNTERAAVAAFEAFPKLKLMAGTIRHVIDVDQHSICGRIDTRSECFQTKETIVAGIIDRIGAGDAYAAGIIHGLLTSPDSIEHAAHAGLALTVLKHSIHGDACLVRPGDIELFHTNSLDIQR